MCQLPSTFAHYAYDAYGNPTETTSTATSLVPAPVAAQIAERNILRYAGYAYDGFSGLYYCSQRYYDPKTVSFVSKDPAKADGEESAYQYCGGDPVGKVDPSGERRQTLWLKWIPTYLVHSYITRQVAYAMLQAAAAKAVATRAWGYCATRLQANLVSKTSTYLVNRFADALSFVPKLDSTVARVWDPVTKYTSGWFALRPQLRIEVFRETTKRATFAEVTAWELKRHFQPVSGYKRTMTILHRRIWTDRQAAEAIRSYSYLRTAK